MKITRANVRAKLSEYMFSLLNAGITVEDLLESILLAIENRRLVSHSQPDPKYRYELLIFYEDASQIMRDAIRRTEIAGRSARRLSERR